MKRNSQETKPVWVSLKNEDVKQAYDVLESEFALVNSLFSMRQQAGLTQEQLAERMGTQKGNISRLEKGNSNPNWKTLEKYAHACGFGISITFKRTVSYGKVEVK
ncbi:helix-turn-helix domain-containing protein [Fluoribacter dumoffii]|uniref:helix-turn-helix domain-containing protein n=1 Tax=Fluoribacter dumoffii TaxID=463 RepID=UPI0022442A8B|nr:helix-turn-helix transcriptional regulator [Fluoribacter dumoffii]MCW8387445.1 helix-turn-helix domain-containing protein [Fluoribacter dumoffii]MCW8417047.1 helix-turn-helix domain-containing protein [Fluoribacter dumoffii]MCW8455113.1 helix-turn-helix domain-containing protein [Fluoribacter dumoffii]MCW8460810.1 helix-turn-helix domain-containing protein [Fluoribacter dumoffii]MCW8484252.1 helix-turn-helix domain-containing protein [Fluoribacter dumoffii]